jgi:fructokinase
MNTPVLCFGEVLWDSLPGGLFLGGAPFNVAYHLRSLGIDALMVSAVGDDALGGIIRRRAAEKGIPTGLLGTEPSAPTGLVHVSLDGAGNASYEIVQPAAWDFIRMTPELRAAAAGASALVFGSLAQRGGVTRATLLELLGLDLLKVFDVNLRPPFDDPGVVEAGLSRSQVVKLNDQEFLRLARWFGLPRSPREGAGALALRYGPTTVCITRGAKGAALWHEERWSEHPGYSVRVRDTVGAGDAFLASLLKGVLDGQTDQEILKRANAHGAFVATRDGATPAIDLEQIRAVEASGA